jgi:hypothetical protein
LKIIHPEITISSIKPEQIKVNQKTINKTDKYPSFAFRESHKLNFSTAGSKAITKNTPLEEVNLYPESYTRINPETIIESYPEASEVGSLSVYYSGFDDFAEGSNVVKARRYMDLFFFAVVSEEQTEVEIDVDRIEPELSLDKKQFKEFYLQEPVTFKATSEVGAKLFNETNLAGKFEKENQNFSITPKNGENTLSLFSQDTFKNNSEKQAVKFNAFYKVGYKRVDCGMLHFVYDSKTYKDPDGCANTDYVSSHTILEPKWFSTNQGCSGPCGFSPEGMVVYKSKESNYDQILQSKFYEFSNTNGGTIHKNQEYETPQGLKGKLLHLSGRDFEGASIINYYFIMKQGDNPIIVSQIIWQSHDQATKDKMKSDFFELIDNMIIEE